MRTKVLILLAILIEWLAKSASKSVSEPEGQCSKSLPLEKCPIPSLLGHEFKIVLAGWFVSMLSLAGPFFATLDSYERIDYNLQDVVDQLVESLQSEVEITIHAFQRYRAVFTVDWSAGCELKTFVLSRRKFSLKLRQARKLFVPQLEVRVLSGDNEEHSQFNPTEYYTGYIEGAF